LEVVIEKFISERAQILHEKQVIYITKYDPITRFCNLRCNPYNTDMLRGKITP
jgi:hypothetical protein